MASLQLRRSQNVEGQFFVDTTCIDCDTCRWMAPETFGREGAKSAVHHQPDDQEARTRAAQAVVACPTASIGTQPTAPEVASAAAGFPALARWDPTGHVFHCGYHSRDSFGAASWLLRTEAGNLLIDSPRFAKPLVRRIEDMGGVARLAMTHQDDVADHQRFHDHFGCPRMIHQDDDHIGAEETVIGIDPVEVMPGVEAVPVPGHTSGSMVYHHAASGALFTGDHMCWHPREERLHAFRRACWYDWDTQIDSMKRLRRLRFTSVFPGHGAPVHRAAGEMAEALEACIAWMEEVA